MEIDIRQLSADLFRQAAAVAGSGNETTPETIGHEIGALCETLHAEPPVFVPVRNDSNGLYGFCNIGVLEKIKIDGGAVRFGWNIWEYPALYLTAEFHAVWISPSGKLTDITPKPDGETRIVFAGDPSYPPDFDFLKRPNNRRARIYQPADRIMLARARIEKLKQAQIDYETKRASGKGLSLEQWIESRLPIDPLPPLIDGFIRDSDEIESFLIPVGLGRLKCTNTDRARELAQQKQQKLAKIQELISRQ